MVADSILQCMTGYAALTRKDVVLDIGAGLGFLTRFLAVRCRSVLAVESDSRLVRVLREQLKDLSNVQIIKGSIFKVQIPLFNKVVSIPPYHISSSLLEWLFKKDFCSAVLVLQEEFVDRLVAAVGSEKYGWLTVVAHYYIEVDLLDKVPKSLFYPQPEVNSVIVRLKRKRPPPFTLESEAQFKLVAQALFRERNRKVKNAISPLIKNRNAGTLENILDLASLFPFHEKRVRELTPEDFGVLANTLAKCLSSSDDS